jgi:hypothetical protein
LLYADILPGAGDGVSTKGIAQRIERDVSRGTQFAADQDNVGIEIIAEIADQAAHLRGGVADDALRVDISVQRQFEKILDADETMSVAHRVSQCVDGHFAFQAATVAAPAQGSHVVDDHMAELAGNSARAAEHLTVDSDAKPDADR